MTKTIKYHLGVILLFGLLVGCSTESDTETANSVEETQEVDEKIEEMSEEISLLQNSYMELEETVRELNLELDNQSTLMSLFPQSWETAEEFIEAYVNLDYEVLDELTSDDYSIEEDGIVLTEHSTHTPYLALRHEELDYLLNNYALAPDTTTNEVFMNIHFHLINDGEMDGLVTMNIVLEKISEEWKVTYIEFS